MEAAKATRIIVHKASDIAHNLQGLREREESALKNSFLGFTNSCLMYKGVTGGQGPLGGVGTDVPMVI